MILIMKKVLKKLNFFGKKIKKNEDTNLIHLIGIKKDSNEEKTKIESIKFCENNIIKFFVISDKNERNIKTFINDLSEQLETRKKNYNQK